MFFRNNHFILITKEITLSAELLSEYVGWHDTLGRLGRKLLLRNEILRHGGTHDMGLDVHLLLLGRELGLLGKRLLGEWLLR